MTTALPGAPATPIFDEVDRWWRDGGDRPVPDTMLSFAGAGAGSGPLRDATMAAAVTATPTSGPGHRLVRPPVPPA